MKQAWLTLAAGMTLVAVGFTQALPPEALLMSRIKRHIAGELDRLPNITCQELVRREHQPAGGTLELLDTIRLEVLSSGDKELFASPGGEFSEGGWHTYVGSGTFGNGYFGNYLKEILLSGGASYSYKGEQDLQGFRVARFDYQLPLISSEQTITMPGASARVSLHGSYWVDTQTNDVIRLELTAGDIPSTLFVAEAVMSVNYGRTALRPDKGTLLPKSAELRLVKSSGEMDINRIEFANCREFQARTTINFDSTESAGKLPSNDAVKTGGSLPPLPGGLELTVKLNSRISEVTAVGTMIDGFVAANVPAKGQVVVPMNSPVRGRIRRLERHRDPIPHFVVALEFTELEVQGMRYRFDADLVEIQQGRGVEETLFVSKDADVVGTADGGTQTTSMVETLSAATQPGVATFFFKGRKLNLTRGFYTKWKTRVVARTK